MTLYEYFLNHHSPKIDLKDNGDKDANTIKYHCLSFGRYCPTDKELSELTDEEIYMVFAQLGNSPHLYDNVVTAARDKIKEYCNNL